MAASVPSLPAHSLSLPDELILMLLNEHSGYFHQVPGWQLNCAVVGAVLAELYPPVTHRHGHGVTAPRGPDADGQPRAGSHSPANRGRAGSAKRPILDRTVCYPRGVDCRSDSGSPGRPEVPHRRAETRTARLMHHGLRNRRTARAGDAEVSRTSARMGDIAMVGAGAFLEAERRTCESPVNTGAEPLDEPRTPVHAG